MFTGFLAESKRFELLIQFPIYTLSRRAPSTTRTTLLRQFARRKNNASIDIDGKSFLLQCHKIGLQIIVCPLPLQIKKLVYE